MFVAEWEKSRYFWYYVTSSQYCVVNCERRIIYFVNNIVSSKFRLKLFKL